MQFQILYNIISNVGTISKFEIVVVTIPNNFKLWNCERYNFKFEIVTVITEILLNCQIGIVFFKLLSFQDLTISNIGIVSNILCNNSHIGIVTTLDPMTVHNNSNLGITRGGKLFYIPGTSVCSVWYPRR